MKKGLVRDRFSSTLLHPLLRRGGKMSRVCELTGTGPVTGSRIRRSGKAKKKGGIGMHVTKVVKRRFLPNLQRVKAVVDGEVKYIRVTAKAIKKGLVTKPPKRNWKKPEA
ncbi:MAG: 50S ribosomal protein L28 [Verrucomicrobiota bacterium]|nr:50S ribosomal protein L28 [Verrucomicrobiota bacterium]